MKTKLLTKYCDAMNPLLQNKQLTEHVPDKYLGAETLFNTWLPVLNRLLKMMPKTNLCGVDFGCAVATPTVLGKLMGIDITGVDISYCRFPKKIDRKMWHINDETDPNEICESVYYKMQMAIKELGYPMEIFDTTIYPWAQFKDNQFDFVIASWSLTKDNTSTQVRKSEQMYLNRINELVRVSKDKAIWIVDGPRIGKTNKHIKFINQFANPTPKGITIFPLHC